MKKLQNGFTLIELMIVVAIIGILAAVAIPAYQDYIIKAKLSKVTAAIDPIKLALSLYYQENGSFPNQTTTAYSDALWTSIGLPNGPTNTPEVINIVINGSAVTTVKMTLTMGNVIKATTINGLFLDITGSPGATAIQWQVGNGSGTCATATPVTDPVAKKYFAC